MTMTDVFGIDASFYQGRINLQAVKDATSFYFFRYNAVTKKWDIRVNVQEPIRFMYAKANQGFAASYVDSRYPEYTAGAHQVGLPIAPYLFFVVDAAAQHGGRAQARRFFESVYKSGYGFELHPMVDVETQPGRDLAWYIRNKARIPGQLHECLEETERLFGVKPGIYTGAWFWNPVMTPPQAWYAEYLLWAADYYHQNAPAIPQGWNRYGVWQFSSRGRVNGIITSCDLNRAPDLNNLLLSTPWQPTWIALPYRVTAGWLNVRSGPGTGYPIVGGLPYGRTITVHEWSPDFLWACIDIDRWASARWLTLVG